MNRGLSRTRPRRTLVFPSGPRSSVFLYTKCYCSRDTLREALHPNDQAEPPAATQMRRKDWGESGEGIQESAGPPAATGKRSRPTGRGGPRGATTRLAPYSRARAQNLELGRRYNRGAQRPTNVAQTPDLAPPRPPPPVPPSRPGCSHRWPRSHAGHRLPTR